MKVIIMVQVNERNSSREKLNEQQKKAVQKGIKLNSVLLQTQPLTILPPRGKAMRRE